MILIALGANLPWQGQSPLQNLYAVQVACERNGLRPLKVSSFYISEAWPNPSDPPYVNAVMQVETSLPPHALLDMLHKIEAIFGRHRSELNAPRSMDLDLLDYDGLIQPGPPILPHPRLQDRAFVLIPLAEIAPDWQHPKLNQPVSTLISTLPKVRHLGIQRILSPLL